MNLSKLKIRWNTDSNGIVIPTEYIIDIENIDWFKEIPEDKVIATSEEHSGPRQYYYSFKKRNIDRVTVRGRRRLRGKDEIGTLVRDKNGEFEYFEYKRDDGEYGRKEREKISSYLGVPYEEIKRDYINGDMFLYNGYPVTGALNADLYDKNNEKSLKRKYLERTGNPFYERLLERVGVDYLEMYYRKIGNFLVSVFNSNYYLEGLYDSKKEEQKEFDDLLEYLDYDVKTAEWRFGALDREETKFEISYSRKYRKNHDIVESFSSNKDGLDKILLMAANGSLSARAYLEARTLVEEKDELEKLIEEKYYENRSPEEVTSDMANVNHGQHSLEEVSEFMKGNDRNLEDIESVLGELKKEVKGNDKDEPKKELGIDD